MEFTKQDLLNSENLIKALKKASFTLEGLEVVAMADVYKWANSLYNRIHEEVNKPALVVTENKNPISEQKLPKRSKKGD